MTDRAYHARLKAHSCARIRRALFGTVEIVAAIVALLSMIVIWY